MKWSDSKKGYESFLRLEKSLSQNSVAAYVNDINKLITFLDQENKKITPEKQYTFDQAKASLEGNLKREAVQKRMQEWEAELKRGATIEIPGTEGGRKQG